MNLRSTINSFLTICFLLCHNSLAKAEPMGSAFAFLQMQNCNNAKQIDSRLLQTGKMQWFAKKLNLRPDTLSVESSGDGNILFYNAYSELAIRDQFRFSKVAKNKRVLSTEYLKNMNPDPLNLFKSYGILKQMMYNKNKEFIGNKYVSDIKLDVDPKYSYTYKSNNLSAVRFSLSGENFVLSHPKEEIIAKIKMEFEYIVSNEIPNIFNHCMPSLIYHKLKLWDHNNKLIEDYEFKLTDYSIK